MSKKELDQVNKVWRTIVCGAAVVLAICALIYNPCHLWTSAIIFAYGQSSEFVNADRK